MKFSGARLSRAATGAALAIVLASCMSTSGDSVRAAAAGNVSKFLYVWSGAADGSGEDYLATINADPASPDYGRMIAQAATGEAGSIPHHTEYTMPASGRLLANGFVGNRSFAFDLTDAARPRVAATFQNVGEGALGFSFPHSFLRLPDGRIVATFQGRGGKYGAPGGIAEITEDGGLVNGVSATAPGVDPSLAWPYSLDYAPREDRIIVTMSEMGLPGQESWAQTHDVQIYDAKTLALTGVVTLPASAKRYDLWPAEPRVAEDGTVFIATFMCGLYRVDNVDSATPTASLAFEFPQLSEAEACAVPVIVGDFLVQPVPAINGLVAVDISDPRNVKEVSRISFDHAYHMPHWLASDGAGRIVVTGMYANWVLVARIDQTTGALSLDKAFGGVLVGETGKTIVHGALFSRP